MSQTRALRDQLTEKLPAFVFLLFTIQPVLDVLSYWTARLEITNLPTTLLRLLMLGLILLGGFCLSRRKKVYFIAAAVCAVILIGHMAACFQFGYQNIFSDVANYIRVVQMPLTVLCLITFMRENSRCYDAMKKGIVVAVMIILVVQVLAVVTGTEPHTYADGYGFIGWFTNTNAQSAILTMAVPVVISTLYQHKGFQNVWLWIVLAGACTSLFFFGTRLCYAGIIAVCFGLGGSMIVIRWRDWKKAAVFILIGLIFIGLIPRSPMVVHQRQYNDEMAQKQGWLGQQVEQQMEQQPVKPSPKPGETRPSMTKEELITVLTPSYKHYVSDFVEIFGVERTIEIFNYSTDITELTATRPKKLLFAKVLMEESPASARFFGLELERFHTHGKIYDVENDFHGIYYLYGGVGLAALLLFLAYFLFLIVKALIKNFKRYFTLDAASWGIGLIMCLGHAYFTAGILRRPNSSIYMSAILAAVYFLVELKNYSEQEELN